VIGLLLAALTACSDYDLKRDEDNTGADEDTEASTTDDDTSASEDSCEVTDSDPYEVGVTDACDYEIGGFTPTEVWTAGANKVCRSTPAVADINGDGRPEIIANISPLFGNGNLVVMHGDGAGTLWEIYDAELAYAASPAVADIDNDGDAEIAVVREYQNSLLAEGDYTVLLYSHTGALLWESAHFIGADFDYGTAPVIADMEADGEPEIVVGRVILNALDGATRGVGAYGRGTWVDFPDLGDIEMSEGTISAVADMNLDGIQEVVVGNAYYSPDGNLVDADPSASDGMVAVANLDDDPEGEFVVTMSWDVRAVDTNFNELWSFRIPTANIISSPAIGDIDGDGYPEIIVAGGNELYALNHDGTVLWQAAVQDETGLSGASIFDFEADGVPEVVYIDEIQMMAFDGATGEVRFQTDAHNSDTMGEYPVIADVDGDGHAEIVVPHVLYGYAISVYEDAADTWAPARPLWNQHAYCVSNINDDLSLPAGGPTCFEEGNSWHAAPDPFDSEISLDDLEAEIIDVCADCGAGEVTVLARLINRSYQELPAGIPVALYGRFSDGDRLVATSETTGAVASGWGGETLEFVVPADDLTGADAVWFVADDDGAGAGIIEECAEANNGFQWSDAFCG